ncbi:hypothetical protein BCR34DRAFT_127434 [Clohesyomyces aquaticus]|uniref:Uncharacterized protein n=1 Tax=Clohesyomyces aquaticus TaxID=1231657 RepID=A0A1Y2AAT3_9PLEO|nr:hypothetical protein BCR34DRAFT_127434 [Clohesyomyces aquaticus]
MAERAGGRSRGTGVRASYKLQPSLGAWAQTGSEHWRTLWQPVRAGQRRGGEERKSSRASESLRECDENAGMRPVISSPFSGPKPDRWPFCRRTVDGCGPLRRASPAFTRPALPMTTVRPPDQQTSRPAGQQVCSLQSTHSQTTRPSIHSRELRVRLSSPTSAKRAGCTSEQGLVWRAIVRLRVMALPRLPFDCPTCFSNALISLFSYWITFTTSHYSANDTASLSRNDIWLSECRGCCSHGAQVLREKFCLRPRPPSPPGETDALHFDRVFKLAKLARRGDRGISCQCIHSRFGSPFHRVRCPGLVSAF